MVIKKLLAGCAVTLLAGTVLQSAVQAQEIDNRANVYGGAIYHFFDNDSMQDNDAGFILGGEVPVSKRWSLDLEDWKLNSDIQNTTTHSEVEVLRLGGNYHLNMKGDWQPYLGVGVGHYTLDPVLPGVDLRETSLDVGVGVKRFLGEHLFVRGDAKLINVPDGGLWDQTLSIAVGYAFGSRSKPVPVASTPVVAPTPAPVDSDGDGVPDSRDNCPNTARDLAVDANGCPIMDSSMMRQDLLVNFDFDKAVVKPEYNAQIKKFADFLQMYTNTNAVIEGHTDSVGTEAYNQELSERRANAVMNVLVNNFGIPASRLTAVGYGESRPKLPNTTAENREANRRIEADVSVKIEEARKR